MGGPQEPVGERALAREAPANELDQGVPALARRPPPSGPTPPAETTSSSTTYVLSQNIMNDGCNFGTAIANSRQDTHIVVEQVMHVAE